MKPGAIDMLPANFLQLHQVVGCFLIHIIVKPVGVKQLGVCAPAHLRFFGWVIIGKIVLRNGYIQALFHIP